MSNIEARIQAALPERMGPMFNGAPMRLQEQHVYDVKPASNQPMEEQSPAYLMINGKHSRPASQQPSQLRAPGQGYVRWLKRLWSTARLLFLYEFLSGNMFKQLLRSVKLGCLAGDGCIEPAVQAIQQFLTPKGLPLALRPFLTGGFLPMILFFWLDFVYLKDYPKAQPLSDLGETFIVVSCFITICLYIIVGVKCSGKADSYALRQRSKDIIRAKPYIRQSSKYCQECKMIRPLRAVHCQQCGICVAKYSKHSIFLNRCIGAGNELLYMLLMLAIIIAVLVILNVFVLQTLRGWMLFKVFYYFINAHLQLQCIIDALELLIYSTIYNCTEYELQHWKELDYMSMPNEHFVNPNDMVRSAITKGFCRNVQEELMGMTCGGQFEPYQLSFQEIARQGSCRRAINWNRSLMFHPAHLPNHPNRTELAQAASGTELKTLYESPPAQFVVQDPRQSTPPRSNRGRRYKASSLQSAQTDKSRLASTQMLVPSGQLHQAEDPKQRLAMTADLPVGSNRLQEVQMVQESPQFDLE